MHTNLLYNAKLLGSARFCPRSPWFGVIVVFFFVCHAFGQVSMDLTSAGNNIVGGVYADPYTAYINGVQTLVICDDYTDESYVPESWSATVTNMASLNTSSTVLWKSGADGLSEDQAYVVAAYLATEIIEAYDTSNWTAAGEYSYALWGLYVPAAFNDIPSEAGVAEADLAAAVTATANQTIANYANVNIYTPNGTAPTCPGYPNGCPNSPPQEFLTVTTPEASTPVLMAVDLFGFIALVGFLRKRMPHSS